MPIVAAVPLLLIVGFLVAYGMALTSRSWTHSLTVWVTHGLGLPNFLADRITEGAVALTKLVTHELGRYAIPATEGVVKWLAGLAQYAALVGYWSLVWPKELYTFGYWLIHTYIPRVIHGATEPIDRRARSAEAIARDAERRAINTRKGVPAAAKTVVIETVPANVRGAARDIEWLRTHWKALTAAVAGAGAIALPWGGAGRIARDVLGLRKLYDRLNRRTVGLGAVALVSAALVRMGLKWLTCNNVKSNLKTLCGFSPIRFADLLLDATAILSLISVVEFAHELQAIEGEAVKILSLGIREFPAV